MIDNLPTFPITSEIALGPIPGRLPQAGKKKRRPCGIRWERLLNW